MNRLLKLSVAAMCCLLTSGAFAQSAPVVPYLTTETHFIHKDVQFSTLQPVSDGVFSLLELNPEIEEYYYFYSFWTIDGDYIFPPMWSQLGRNKPHFDSGACIVKDPKTSTVQILHKNGNVIELPKTYGEVTQFEDGISMVREATPSGVNTFYIDVNGNKIFPDLEENNLSYNTHTEIRPVKCGLRAYYSNEKKAWGYLDAEGNVKIQPKFGSVRDFANNYALVICKTSNYEGYLALIDKSGNEVCRLSDANITNISSAAGYSDVSAEGIYAVSDGRGENTQYFTINPHAQVHKTYIGMNFEGGYAFMIPEDAEEDRPIVVDKNFRQVGTWDFTYSDFGYRKPVFSPIGLVTVANRWVLDTKGKTIIAMPSSYDYEIGDFCDEGYAPFEAPFKNVDAEGEVTVMTGYCRSNGEIVIAFYAEEEGGRYIGEDPIGPTPTPGPGPGPGPGPEPIPVPPLPPDPPDPWGPKIRTGAKYDVTVEAVPAEAAQVMGSGQYSLRDTVHVRGQIVKGWKLASIECDPKRGTNTQDFNKFLVTGNMNIKCYFVKDIKPETPPTTTYRGTAQTINDGKTIDVPVWLEMDADKGIRSPYGDKTYGYLAVCFDPDLRMKVENSDGESFIHLNMFMAPMLVKGIHTDPETKKTYLMLDGGEVCFGNMFVEDKRSESESVNNFNTGMANLMMLFDNFNEITITPARYRIEIKEGSVGSDSFTFGILERLSVEHGWLPGGDEVFTEKKNGLFIRSESVGLDKDMLMDRKMSRSTDKPKVYWCPTKGFYGEMIDNDTLRELVISLGRNYRSFVSDIDMFTNFNIGDFIIWMETR